MKANISTASAALALLLSLAHVGAAADKRPNFVLMFVDNVGYGDLGCYGNRQVKTPNIDRFSTEGVRCTDFYVGAPSCSPSRGAVLTALDAAIGRVLRALDELKLRNNTVVIALSDNGAFMRPGEGFKVQSNKPFRGGGVMCCDGGIRVPCMVRWPGRIKPGTVCSEMLSSLDLLPMIVHAAGGEPPVDIVFDGKDATAALTGDAPTPHDQLCWIFRKYSAIRWRNYKLIKSDPKQPWALYDLEKDSGETVDLVNKHPQLAEQIQTRFERWLASIHGERKRGN